MYTKQIVTIYNECRGQSKLPLHSQLQLQLKLYMATITNDGCVIFIVSLADLMDVATELREA